MKSEPEVPEPSPEGRPAWADLHLWQIQPVRDVLMVLVVLGILLLGERLSLVTVPLLLALLLAHLFEPLVARLALVKWFSRRFAAGGIVVLSVLMIGVPLLIAAGLGILQGIDFASGVAGKAGAVISSLEEPKNEELRAAVGEGGWLSVRDFFAEIRVEAQSESGESLSVLGIDRPDLMRATDFVMGWVRDNAQQLARKAIDTGQGALTVAVSTFTSLGMFVFGAFLTAFFFFFASAAWPDLSAFVTKLLPEENRERALNIATRMNRAVQGFLRGRLTIALVLGVFYTIGFALMGVPAPLILGPAVSVITLIPYAGLLAVPFVMVLLWLQGNEGFRGEIWWVILAPFAWYQIGQSLDDYLLTPLIQGKSTDLDTPTILFASIAGGILLGFFGLLVAIPLAACTKILLIEVFWPRFKAWTGGKEGDFLPLDRGD